MAKLNLEYVISACGMAGVFTPLQGEASRDELFKSTILSMMDSVNKSIEDTCHNTNSFVSVLYNAYTEEKFVEEFKKLNNLGGRYIHADSGGLQMVTAGKQITEEIKDKIYEVQTYSDYAMCFDVIPLSSLSETRTRNERSNVKNKVFNQDKHEESGTATGMNIKRQIEVFKRMGAKTKVIAIIQGNSAEDMLLYCQKISACLTEEDYTHIGGIALADTCMGNGEAESIEMLKGAKLISKDCHENFKSHLHILGVGSISRMRPIIYLINSGYLASFKHISYDSSSHTCCFDYGLLKLNGTCKPLGNTGTQKAVSHFSNVYDFFENTFKELGTKEKFIEVMFGDRSRDWKFSTIKQGVFATGEDKLVVMGIAAKAAHTLYMVANFVYNVDKIQNTHSKSRGIESLRMVKDEESMKVWEDHNLNTKFIRSKRINRDESFSSLESFLQ